MKYKLRLTTEAYIYRSTYLEQQEYETLIDCEFMNQNKYYTANIPQNINNIIERSN